MSEQSIEDAIREEAGAKRSAKDEVAEKQTDEGKVSQESLPQELIEPPKKHVEDKESEDWWGPVSPKEQSIESALGKPAIKKRPLKPPVSDQAIKPDAQEQMVAVEKIKRAQPKRAERVVLSEKSEPVKAQSLKPKLSEQATRSIKSPEVIKPEKLEESLQSPMLEQSIDDFAQKKAKKWWNPASWFSAADGKIKVAKPVVSKAEKIEEAGPKILKEPIKPAAPKAKIIEEKKAEPKVLKEPIKPAAPKAKIIEEKKAEPKVLKEPVKPAAPKAKIIEEKKAEPKVLKEPVKPAAPKAKIIEEKKAEPKVLKEPVKPAAPKAKRSKEKAVPIVSEPIIIPQEPKRPITSIMPNQPKKVSGGLKLLKWISSLFLKDSTVVSDSKSAQSNSLKKNIKPELKQKTKTEVLLEALGDSLTAEKPKIKAKVSEAQSLKTNVPKIKTPKNKVLETKTPEAKILRNKASETKTLEPKILKGLLKPTALDPIVELTGSKKPVKPTISTQKGQVSKWSKVPQWFSSLPIKKSAKLSVSKSEPMVPPSLNKPTKPAALKSKIKPATQEQTAQSPQQEKAASNWGPLKWFPKLQRLIADAGFALPLKTWDKARNILLSVFLASFLINLLSLVFPLTLLQVYDRIIPNMALNTLVLLVMGVGVALLFETALRITRSYVSAWADVRFEHTTGYHAFRSLLQGSMQYFNREGPGVHVKRLNALTMLRDFYSGQALIVLADIPFILLLLLLIGYIAHWLVIVPAAIAVIFLVGTTMHSKQLQNLLTQRKEQDDRRYNYIIETLTNIHTVKSMSMEAQMMRRYESLQKTASINDYDVSLKNAYAMRQGLILSQLTIILVVSFGSILIMNGQLTIGGLAACTLLSGRCLQPINTMVSVWMRLQTIKIAHNELQKIFKIKPESLPSMPNIKIQKGKIEFKEVSFRYKEDDPWLLDKMNFVIEPKEAVGINGAGLSGKTSICALLLRMLQAQKGKLLIDDQDITQYNAHGLREQIAYLPQEGVLFKGTIMDNLTMFQKEEFEKRAMALSEKLGLAEVVAKLPDGYNTMLANQTTDQLPRGLKQRIIIARGLMREAKIVLFDEANTAIDMRGDAFVKKLLEELVGKVTLIIVSHRPSVLSIADKQLILKDGHMKVEA